jgi:HSP20 family protein
VAKAEIAVTDTSSIIEEIMRRQDMVARRAFELFQSHMNSFNAELEDWLMAERELAMPPEIQLRRQNGQFEIDAAMPDIDPKKLDVKVTPEDVLITAEREIMKAEGKTAAEAGKTAEGTMRYFSAIHLPEPIDPGAVEASFKKGVLHLTAKLAKTEPKQIDVRV